MYWFLLAAIIRSKDGNTSLQEINCFMTACLQNLIHLNHVNPQKIYNAQKPLIGYKYKKVCQKASTGSWF